MKHTLDSNILIGLIQGYPYQVKTIDFFTFIRHQGWSF
ncbi:Uncharacterised protein [Corynebacterium matruchotii]|nr:Uncharacterised protein [Corynebacterium matruchotii]